MNEDTIAAIATAPGEGGVAIVRLSGPRAIAIADALTGGRPSITSAPSHTVHHAWLHDDEGRPLDEAVVVVMRAPRSYTGEDVVELGTHGGPVSPRRVLRAALARGARLAERGEFTRRAFMNGRIDLSQAEAVEELVRARTERGADAALRALAGKLAEKTLAAEDHLLDALSRIETNLDFVEDVAPAPRAEIARSLAGCRDELEVLERDAVRARRLREGATVVLLGRPNVGKSSLFNALVQDDRAIVSETPGTTRDWIEAWIDVAGIPVRLIDTAGLRAAADALEQEGVRRTEKLEATADLRLVLLEAPQGRTGEDEEILRRVGGRDSIVVWNKCDEDTRPINGDEGLRVSARTGEALGELRSHIAERLGGTSIDDAREEILVAERHEDAIRRAIGALDLAVEAWARGATEELVAADLRTAASALGEITGKSVGESVLARIFERFCIGK